MLGPPADVDACERWMRWGALTYFELPGTPEHVIGELIRATENDVAETDASFHRLGAARRMRVLVEILAGFTHREIEVLPLVGRGLTNQQMGVALGMSQSTVEEHLSEIYQKLSVANRAQAMARLHPWLLLARARVSPGNAPGHSPVPGRGKPRKCP